MSEGGQTAREEIAVPDGTGTAGRARDASSRAAEWTWGLIRRIHLGTRKPANWMQLFKFGVVGGTGYLVNLVAFGLLAGPLGVHHIAAAIGAFCVAVTNNFLINRHWTFAAEKTPEGRGRASFQAPRFFAVSVGGLGVNLIVLYLLVDVGGAPELLSQAIAVAVAMPVNFIGNKLWTFG